MSRPNRLLVASMVALASILTWSGPAPTGATASAPGGCYVAANHRIFLDRDATSAELAEWGGRFDAGTPHHRLPAELAASDEWLSVVVARVYDDALERQPEPEGESYWIDQLRSGAMVTRIAAMVFGSDEFYDRVGHDDEELVLAFYELILDRRPDDGGAARRVDRAEVDYWVDQLPARGRGGVAAAIHGSFESRARRVDRLYRAVLDRSADAAGRAYWAERLATVNDVRLAVFLAASGELRARSARGCTLADQVTLTDLTPTATWAGEPDVSRDGRHVVFAASAGDPFGGHRDVHLLDTATDATTNLTAGADGSSGAPSISADGGLVVFESRATDLTDDPDDGARDVFLHDVATGTTTNLTTATTRDATSPTISADGSTVAYLLEVGGFTRTAVVHDLVDDSTTDVTAATDADIGYVDLSGDGTLVAVSTFADDLTPDPDNGEEDVLVFDRATDEVVNVTATGDRGSFDPALSADGTRLVFRSGATTFGGPGRGHISLFAADLMTGAIAEITPGINDDVDDGPSISDDGSIVAFSSSATNLTGDPDNNGASDVFLTSAAPGGPIVNLTATTFLTAEPEDAGSTSPVLAGNGGSVTFVTEAPELIGREGRSLVRAR